MKGMDKDKKYSPISEFTIDELQHIRVYGWDKFCGEMMGHKVKCEFDSKFRHPPEELDFDALEIALPDVQERIQVILNYGYILG